jgi:hypothetical protein
VKKVNFSAIKWSTFRLTKTMRLTFNIDEGTAASALHWELLYDPDQGPLALLDTPVMRYLPQQAVIPTLKTDLPLKVLLTGAQTAPEDAAGRGLEAIKDVLEGPNLSPYVQITVEPHLTFAKLQKLLRQGFHVWHFVGRADTDPRSATAQIYCEDASRPIDARQLNILLNRSGVRLVVLDTIRDGELALDPLRRLAAAVVRAQVPAAIGAQFTAHSESARAFTEEFYRALAEGFPIDACVTEGRKAVMSAVGLDLIDWASPVVFTRAPDGKLFDLPAASAPDITGQIVFPPGELWRGRAVAVNSTDGALLFAAGPPQIERLAQKPRPPRRVRGFVGRDRELAEIQKELQPGGGAWLFGSGGCGLSTLLREVANAPAASALPDGVAYVDGGAEPPFLDDVLQRLFDRFYAASPPLKVGPEAARTSLSNVQALFALDALPLNNADIRRLADALADSAVLVAAEAAGPDTLLRVRLGGLNLRDAVVLCAAAVDLAEPDADVAAWQRIRDKTDPNREQFWMDGTTLFDRLDVFDALFYFDISRGSSPTQYMNSYLNNRLKPYNTNHPGANKPFIGTVQAGYDDTRIRGPEHRIEPHTQDAAYYKATWQFAIDKRACAVVLSTFNEFYEGSHIEPSKDFKGLYLEVTKQKIQEYKGAP